MMKNVSHTVFNFLFFSIVNCLSAETRLLVQRPTNTRDLLLVPKLTFPQCLGPGMFKNLFLSLHWSLLSVFEKWVASILNLNCNVIFCRYRDAVGGVVDNMQETSLRFVLLNRRLPWRGSSTSTGSTRPSTRVRNSSLPF